MCMEVQAAVLGKVYSASSWRRPQGRENKWAVLGRVEEQLKHLDLFLYI